MEGKIVKKIKAGTASLMEINGGTLSGGWNTIKNDDYRFADACIPHNLPWSIHNILIDILYTISRQEVSCLYEWFPPTVFHTFYLSKYQLPYTEKVLPPRHLFCWQIRENFTFIFLQPFFACASHNLGSGTWKNTHFYKFST